MSVKSIVLSSAINSPHADNVRNIIFDDSDPNSIEFELAVALQSSLKFKENTVHIITSSSGNQYTKLVNWIKKKNPNIELKWFPSTQKYMEQPIVCPVELHNDVRILWDEIRNRSNIPTTEDKMINYLKNSVRHDLSTQLFSIKPPRYVPQTAALLVKRWETWNLATQLYEDILPYDPPMHDSSKLVNWLTRTIPRRVLEEYDLNAWQLAQQYNVSDLAEDLMLIDEEEEEESEEDEESEEENEEIEEECIICRDREASHVANPCGHRCCKICWEEYFETSGKMICPICRATVRNISLEGLAVADKNIYIYPAYFKPDTDPVDYYESFDDYY